MNGYVAGGWASTAAVLAAYTWRTLRRGRLLRQSLPAPTSSGSPPSPSDPADMPAVGHR